MTETSHLTGFLLARIAEEETDAFLGEWMGLALSAEQNARIYRELEAKRRIVDEHEGPHNCVRYIDVDDNRDCLTLRALAAVYADRPDYSDEWRP